MFSGIDIQQIDSSDDKEEIPFAVVGDIANFEQSLDIIYCGDSPHSHISVLHERINYLHGFSPFQVIMTYLITQCPLLKCARAEVLSQAVLRWKSCSENWRDACHVSCSSSSKSANTSEHE